MNLCKAKLPDGKPCPNQADMGQKYCPFHLAKQVAPLKKSTLKVFGALGILGTAAAAVKYVPWKSIAHSGGKIAQSVVEAITKNRHM